MLFMGSFKDFFCIKRKSVIKAQSLHMTPCDKVNFSYPFNWKHLVTVQFGFKFNSAKLKPFSYQLDNIKRIIQSDNLFFYGILMWHNVKCSTTRIYYIPTKVLNSFNLYAGKWYTKKDEHFNSMSYLLFPVGGHISFTIMTL